ncbi:hypothetical protein BJ508DRAFT_325673 [Ascobolus immersus RN42]|uniref:Uncharacterized protein n=1 Tax=Ascobolus immersus RN42 TaxID=1160509 RepID=A0A3N4I8K8_ASCIM|nr:hypothetical protein BJ508DRAFT_325673 [Ascobolus immersus RN42]
MPFSGGGGITVTSLPRFAFQPVPANTLEKEDQSTRSPTRIPTRSPTRTRSPTMSPTRTRSPTRSPGQDGSDNLGSDDFMRRSVSPSCSKSSGRGRSHTPSRDTGDGPPEPDPGADDSDPEVPNNEHEKAKRARDPSESEKTMFVWKHKHQIGDVAYQELMHILQRIWFDPKALPLSATTLKSYANHLPLQNLYTSRVKQLVSKGFSNTRSRYTNMYTFSIADTLRRMLSNPEIYEQSTFGPAVKLPSNKKAMEVRHGELLRQSVTAVPQLYPQKTLSEEYIHPGGFYECLIRDPFTVRMSMTMLVRVTGLFLQDDDKRQMTVDSTFDRDDLWVTVQPVLTKESHLRLFGLREHAEKFIFEGNEYFILEREYDMKLNRLLRKVTIHVDRTNHNLDDVLPEFVNKPDKKARGKRKALTKKPARKAPAHSGSKVGKKSTSAKTSSSSQKQTTRGKRQKTTTTDHSESTDHQTAPTTQRSTRAQTRSQNQHQNESQSQADTGPQRGKRARVEDESSEEETIRPDSSHEDEDEASDPEYDDTQQNEVEDANGLDGDAQLMDSVYDGYEVEELEDEGHESEEDLDEEYLANLKGEQPIPIVTDSLPAPGEGTIREMIVPEKGSRFDNQLFIREAPVQTFQNQEPYENRGLRHVAARLISAYETETKITVKLVRLISCGHLREVLAELEIRANEFTWDELQKSKDGLLPPRLGLMMDFYCDKFGVFRTTHRSSGGLYATLMNLNYRGRDQPRNHACVGFIPNGTSFQGGAMQVLKEFATLAKGSRMTIRGKDFMVHVKLLSTTSDMAEANELAGVNNSQSNTCCRFCFAPRTITGDEGAFFQKNWVRRVLDRNIHLCERFRRERTKADLNRLGIVSRRPILQMVGPAFDPYVQIPVDISHSEQKGMGMLAIKNMMEKLLSPVGKEEFTRVFTSHPFPSNISRIVNPTVHHKRLHMHEVTTVLSSMLFLLKRMDTSKPLFRPSIFEKYQEKYPEVEWNTERLMGFLVEMHIAMARSNQYCFKRYVSTPVNEFPPSFQFQDRPTKLVHSYTRAMCEEDYIKLEDYLFESRRLLYEVYAPFEKTTPQFRRNHRTGREFIFDKVGGTIRHLPNFHQAAHMQESARRFGTLLNVSCSIGELVHKLFKQLVPHTNYLDMDKSFCRYWNIMDSLREVPYTIDCLPEHPWNKTLEKLRRFLPSLMSGYFFGQIARYSEDFAWVTNTRGEAAKLSLMKQPRFPDIFFGTRIKDGEAKTLYPTTLHKRDPLTDDIARGLVVAYVSYGLSPDELVIDRNYVERTIVNGAIVKSTIAHAKLKWWTSLSYYDTIRESTQNIRLNDILTVDESTANKLRGMSEFKDAYAKIKGICTHNNKGTSYVFLYVEWMAQKWRVDARRDPNMGDLEIYDLYPMEMGLERRWTSFVSLNALSATKAPYFIPASTDEQTGLHSYHLNEWFSKSV